MYRSNKSRRIAQLRAIGYAARKKEEETRRAFIVEHDGSLELFEKSGYKTMRGYINSLKAK